MWTGGIIIFLTIIISILTGLYSDYYFCNDYRINLKEEINIKPIPGSTITDEQKDYVKTMEIIMLCNNTKSNIYISYLIIIIGISLLVSGFITEKIKVK
jgi:hypothetical protein